MKRVSSLLSRVPSLVCRSARGSCVL